MGLYIATTYVDVTDEDRRISCGDDPPYETAYDDPGDLFRALQGRSRLRPWEEGMGRCTGKVYVDDGDGNARQVGWVFVSRQPVDYRRPDDPRTWLREAWVTVCTAPDTVTRTPHYYYWKGLTT